MTVIDRSALLPFAPRQLFDLVNDIEAYPSFMDGCVGARVLSRKDDLIEARLDLSRGGISQSFSTRNTLIAPREITLELLDGPFEYLRGCWQFHTLGEAACKMTLNLEFRMNSTVLSAATGKLFDRVTNNLVDAVSRRAHELYS